MWKFRRTSNNSFPPATGADESLKRRPTVRIWIERLLLVWGLVLLGIYGAARIESLLNSRAALEKFEALSSSATTATRNEGEGLNAPEDADSTEVDFSLWDQHRIEAYKESLIRQPGTPLGVLRISKINLEVPLLDGTDDLTLNHAVGRIEGTARPGQRGNIGIAGHRDGFFRGLKDVSVGDEIELKTLEGTDNYIVDRIKIVTPKDVEVLQPRSAPSLTLVTCYPFYFFGSAPQRYIVMASLSGETQNGSEKSESPAVISNTHFTKEEQ